MRASVRIAWRVAAAVAFGATAALAVTLTGESRNSRSRRMKSSVMTFPEVSNYDQLNLLAGDWLGVTRD